MIVIVTTYRYLIFLNKNPVAADMINFQFVDDKGAMDS